jgi:hypothetical protein
MQISKKIVSICCHWTDISLVIVSINTPLIRYDNNITPGDDFMFNISTTKKEPRPAAAERGSNRNERSYANN